MYNDEIKNSMLPTSLVVAAMPIAAQMARDNRSIPEYGMSSFIAKAAVGIAFAVVCELEQRQLINHPINNDIHHPAL